MSTQISTQTISFNNQALITFEQNGTHYTAMKPICENIGLTWHAQYERIKRDEILSQGILIIRIPTNGGDQQMICLPIEYLNGWLFGIDINRCKPEIRKTLIKYKKECYQALHDYWFKGKAERSQIAPIVEPKIPMELTKKEWLCFASMWFALYNSLEVLATLEKPLRTIGSPFGATAYTHATEYQTTLGVMKRILEPMLADFEVDPFEEAHYHKALTTLRQYQPKGLGGLVRI
ncbi:hypothetical protein OF381_00360 [Mannheimia haemolytica]